MTNIEVSRENRQCFYQRRSSLIAIDGIFLRIPNYLQGTVAVASESHLKIFLDTVLGKIMLPIFNHFSFKIVVPEKIHTPPTEEISAVPRGRGERIVSDNSKCIRTSEGGRGVNFLFPPWEWYGCFLK